MEGRLKTLLTSLKDDEGYHADYSKYKELSPEQLKEIIFGIRCDEPDEDYPDGFRSDWMCAASTLLKKPSSIHVPIFAELVLSGRSLLAHYPCGVAPSITECLQKKAKEASENSSIGAIAREAVDYLVINNPDAILPLDHV